MVGFDGWASFAVLVVGGEMLWLLAKREPGDGRWYCLLVIWSGLSALRMRPFERRLGFCSVFL